MLKRLLSILLAAALCAVSPVLASVDDAHSFSMEAANPYVEQGFIVREDFYNGEVKSGQKLMIKHQLFKGNEYAFWLGTANDKCKLEIQIFDEKNKPVHIAPTMGTGDNFTSVRVNPPRTGTYTVVFSVTSPNEKGVFWALAYGYR
jgi:hypothetical protein